MFLSQAEIASPAFDITAYDEYCQGFEIDGNFLCLKVDKSNLLLTRAVSLELTKTVAFRDNNFRSIHLSKQIFKEKNGSFTPFLL